MPAHPAGKEKSAVYRTGAFFFADRIMPAHPAGKEKSAVYRTGAFFVYIVICRGGLDKIERTTSRCIGPTGTMYSRPTALW